nr:MAG TPA: hypothetical protein [Caudoviricetes sp.]
MQHPISFSIRNSIKGRAERCALFLCLKLHYSEILD